jgi:hypothetical protein
MLDDTRLQNRKAMIISSVIFFGMIISIIFHYVLNFYNGLGYPYSTFLFQPKDNLNDYRNMHNIIAGLSPYRSGYTFNSNYFPFGSLFFFPFTLVGSANSAVNFFILLFMIVYVGGLWCLYRKNKFTSIVGFGLIFFFNYPVLFALDRANVEIYLFVFIALFAYFYHYKKNELLACLFLSAAISMKLYPAVLMIILIRDKKWRGLLYVIIISLILTIVPLFIFKGTFVSNVQDMLQGFRDFNTRSEGINGIQHNSTLFGAITITEVALKIVFLSLAKSLPTLVDFQRQAVFIYSIVVMLLFIAVSVFIVLKRINTYRSWMILTGVMIIFPTVSYDYKLILLIIPLVMFIIDTGCHKLEYDEAILYGLMFIPKDYLILRDDVSIASIINPLILSCMLVLCLMRGKRDAKTAVSSPVGCAPDFNLVLED